MSSSSAIDGLSMYLGTLCHFRTGTNSNDTDSIATMAGSIAGAMHGASNLPKYLLDEFLQVNGVDYQLEELTQELTTIATRNAAVRTV